MRYFEVYFRIKSAYHGASRFPNDEQKEAFYTEVTGIFENDGWEIIFDKSSGSVDSAKKDKQGLYLHPLVFSGVIQEDSIEHLRGLLSSDMLTTFRCYHVDVYHEYKDMSDNEYLSFLHARENEMEHALLEMCRTKRKNLYVVGNRSDLIESVARSFAVRRLGHSPGDDKENMVVREVFDRLIRTGAIEVSTTTGGIGYRTAVKKEGVA